jgi:hypothetical protein
MIISSKLNDNRNIASFIMNTTIKQLLVSESKEEEIEFEIKENLSTYLNIS